MTLTVAVSGLHRGENPQPGAPVVMSLRRRFPELKVIGLVYDAWESSIYADRIADCVYRMPFPQAGSEALWQRLDYILNCHHLDLIIPCLDAELPCIKTTVTLRMSKRR